MGWFHSTSYSPYSPVARPVTEPSPIENGKAPVPEKPSSSSRNDGHAHQIQAGKSKAKQLIKEMRSLSINDKGPKKSNKIAARTLKKLDNNQIRDLSSMLGVSSTEPQCQKEKIVEYFDKFNALQRLAVGVGHPIEMEEYEGLLSPEQQAIDPKAISLLGLDKSQIALLEKASKELGMVLGVKPNTQPAELGIYFRGSFTEDPDTYTEDVKKQIVKALGGRGKNSGKVEGVARIVSGIRTYKKDIKKHIVQTLGGRGDDSEKINEAAQVFSEILLINRDVKLDLIGGHSAGGAKALCFKAALESRIQLSEKPVLIVADPQLPNKSMIRNAIKDTPYGSQYDYMQDQGVAITLNSADDPRKNLMGRMKTAGYPHEGLMEVKLPVEYGDALLYGIHPALPTPMKFLGYHSEMEVFEKAIHRFAHPEAYPEEDSNGLPIARGPQLLPQNTLPIQTEMAADRPLNASKVNQILAEHYGNNTPEEVKKFFNE